LFRTLGYPIDRMIQNDRTTFVMGEIHFRFIGPAAYGDRVTLKLELVEMREKTLHWHCTAKRTLTGEPVTEGRATRVYARINEDGTLKSAPIPEEMRRVLTSNGMASLLGKGDPQERPAWLPGTKKS
jgi:acyl-CoA thioesterase FadM